MFTIIFHRYLPCYLNSIEGEMNKTNRMNFVVVTLKGEMDAEVFQ